MISGLFLVAMYVVRYGMFKAIVRKDIFPQIFIAPRGLISILLFFAIPQDFKLPDFESGVLLVIIIVSSLVMAWSLMAKRSSGKEEFKDDELAPVVDLSVDENNEGEE